MCKILFNNYLRLLRNWKKTLWGYFFQRARPLNECYLFIIYLLNELIKVAQCQNVDIAPLVVVVIAAAAAAAAVVILMPLQYIDTISASCAYCTERAVFAGENAIKQARNQFTFTRLRRR